MNWSLEEMRIALLKALASLINPSQTAQDAPGRPKPAIPAIDHIPPSFTPPKYLWNNAINARHSVRVICDEMGLSLYEKNLITACIQQESNFNNNAIGRNVRDGTVVSTDWGICQINDFYHVGPGKRWASVQQILDNPDKAVRWMIQMFKQGKLTMWVSFTSGAYKKFMP